MSTWPELPIEQVCSEVVDCVNRTAPVVDHPTPYKMIRTPNIRNGRIDLESVNYVDQATYEKWTRRLVPQRGDVFLTREAPLGESALLTSDEQVFLGQRIMHYRPDPAVIDGRFLAFSLRSPRVLGHIMAKVTPGATVAHIRVDDAKTFLVPVPDLPTQRRIADILSAYDDLIENNRRRMALLEESVHLLYREWFVRLRFPGHERVKVVDGLPEGWRIATLSEVCPGKEGIQTGPFGSQLHAHEYSDVGVPVVNPQDMVGPRLSTAAIARVREEVAQRLARHRMQMGDIVYGRRGDIGRRALIGLREAGWLCGTGSLRLRPDGGLARPLYLLHTLDSDVTRGAIRNRAKGATMPNLSAQLMQTVPVMLPPVPMQVDFERFAEDAEAMVANLLAANQKLAEARDLLLPRLMDGSLPV